MPLAILLVAGFGLAMLWRQGSRLWRWLRIDSSRRARAAERALVRGHVAAAAGRASEGLKSAVKAQKIGGSSSVAALVLSAEAAEAADRPDLAIDAYETLAADPTTRFLGLKGQLRLALKEHKSDQARQLATEAFALEPGSAVCADALIALAANQGDFATARQVVDTALRAGGYDRATAKRRRGLICYAEAEGLLAQGTLSAADKARYRDLAVEAVELALDAPAFAIAAAKAEAAMGHLDAGLKILGDAFSLRPHPDLAAAAALLGTSTGGTANGPAPSPSLVKARIDQLTRRRPNHVESKLAIARAALDHDDYTHAAEALAPLVTKDAKAGTYGLSFRASLLMARLVRDGHTTSEPAARREAASWLAQAEHGVRDDLWRCRQCGEQLRDWHAACPRCGAFDSFEWPDAGEVAIQNTAPARKLVAIENARALDDPGLDPATKPQSLFGRAWAATTRLWSAKDGAQ
jgi:HemY protein